MSEKPNHKSSTFSVHKYIILYRGVYYWHKIFLQMANTLVFAFISLNCIFK